jgi:hypothetical protein
MGNMTKLRKYHSEAAKLHEIIKPGVTYRVKDLATESGMPFSTVHYVVRKTLEQNKPGSPLWSLPVVEAAPEAKMNLASSVTSIKSAEVYIPAVERIRPLGFLERHRGDYEITDVLSGLHLRPIG